MRRRSRAWIVGMPFSQSAEHQRFNSNVHLPNHFKLAPGWSLAEQVDQHLFGFKMGVRKERGHICIITRWDRFR